MPKASLRTKLFPITITFLILITFLIIMLFWSMGRADWRRKRVELSFSELEEILELRDIAGGQTRMTYRLLLGEDVQKEFQQAERNAGTSFSELERTVDEKAGFFGEGELNELEDIRSLKSEYNSINAELEDAVLLAQAGEKQKAEEEYNSTLERYQDEFLPLMRNIISGELSEISLYEEDAKRASNLVKILAWVIVGLAIIVAIGFVALTR